MEDQTPSKNKKGIDNVLKVLSLKKPNAFKETNVTKKKNEPSGKKVDEPTVRSVPKRAVNRKVLSEEERKKRHLDHILALHEDNMGMSFLSDDDDDDDNACSSFGIDKSVKKKKKAKSEGKFKKNITDFILDEIDLMESKGNKDIYYPTAVVPPSKYPPRKLCAVCGFEAKYTCTTCGDRFCCIKCNKIHQETRCSKYVT